MVAAAWQGDLAADQVLALPVRLAGYIAQWPDQPAWLRRGAGAVLTAFIVVSIAASTTSLLSDGMDAFGTLGWLSDALADFSAFCKLLCLRYYATELYSLRRSLQADFAAAEAILAPEEAQAANRRCVRRTRAVCKLVWALHVMLGSLGFLVNVLGATMPREERVLCVAMHPALLQNDVFFWTLFPIHVVYFSGFMFGIGACDMFLYSLCMHLEAKCQVLQALLERVGQGLRGEVDDEALRTCARYHQLIIRLWEGVERIFRRVTLVSYLYLLMGVGMTLVRLVREGVGDAVGLLYFTFYVSLDVVQLTCYCMLSDALAHESQAVSLSALAALRPPSAGPLAGLSPRGRHVVQLMALRAQRPMHLSAGGLVRLSRELWLEVIRQSQYVFNFMLSLP